MAVIVRVLIPGTTLSNTLPVTALYTSNGVTTIVDKFTATNHGAAATTVTVYTSTTAENDNVIVLNKTLQVNETYTFPEMVGQVIAPNGTINAVAGAATSINIRVSGRTIS